MVASHTFTHSIYAGSESGSSRIDQRAVEQLACARCGVRAYAWLSAWLAPPCAPFMLFGYPRFNEFKFKNLDPWLPSIYLHGFTRGPNPGGSNTFVTPARNTGLQEV